MAKKTKKTKSMTPIQVLQAVEKQILDGVRETAELMSIVAAQGKRIMDLEARVNGPVSVVQQIEKAVSVDPGTGGKPY